MSWGTENDLGAQEMDQKTSGQILSTSIVQALVNIANFSVISETPFSC